MSWVLLGVTLGVLFVFIVVARARLSELAADLKLADAIADGLRGEARSVRDQLQMAGEAAVTTHAMLMSVEDERERLQQRLVTQEEQATAERRELLDRFLPAGLPQGLSAAGELPQRKLNVNEADEIEGLSPATVAAARGNADAALEEARKLVPFVDEIARQEGIPLDGTENL